MKRLAMTALLIVIPLALFAQTMQAPAPEKKMLQQLGLTDAQVSQVMDIQSKTMMTIRQDAAQARVLRAQIEKAMVATSVDMTAVNGLVDQLTQVRGSIQKTFLAARVQLQQIMGPDNFQIYMRHVRHQFAHRFMERRQGPEAMPGQGPDTTPGQGGFGWM